MRRLHHLLRRNTVGLRLDCMETFGVQTICVQSFPVALSNSHRPLPDYSWLLIRKTPVPSSIVSWTRSRKKGYQACVERTFLSAALQLRLALLFLKLYRQACICGKPLADKRIRR